MKKFRFLLAIILVCPFSFLIGIPQSVNQKTIVNGTITPPSNLLDGKKATAQWIWAPGEQNPRNQYLLIRKTIKFLDKPDSLIAYISAYAVADVYVNGKLVDRCPMNSDPEFQVYEKFDLTPLFQKGENTISAIVYNYGIGMHHRINARGGFFFQSYAHGIEPGPRLQLGKNVLK